MSDPQSQKQAELRDRLVELLSTDFSDLPTASVYAVFAEVSQAIEMRRRMAGTSSEHRSVAPPPRPSAAPEPRSVSQYGTQPTAAAPLRGEARGAGLGCDVIWEPELPRIQFVAQADGNLQAALTRALTSGGFLLQLHPAPEKAGVRVEVQFRAALGSEPVAVAGYVVHVKGANVAVTVEPLPEETRRKLRVALESIAGPQGSGVGGGAESVPTLPRPMPVSTPASRPETVPSRPAVVGEAARDSNAQTKPPWETRSSPAPAPRRPSQEIRAVASDPPVHAGARPSEAAVAAGPGPVRGPTTSPMQALSIDSSGGPIPEDGIAALLVSIAAVRPRVQIEIEGRKRRWRLLVRDEAVVEIGMDPEDARYSFSACAGRMELLGEGQIDALTEESERIGRTVEEVAISRGILSARDARAVATARAKLLLRALIEFVADRYAIRPDPGHEIALPTQPIPLRATVIEHFMKRPDGARVARIESRLSGDASAYPMPSGSAARVCEGAGLDAGTLRAVTLLREAREPFRAAAANLGLPDSTLRQLIAALESAGLIEWQRRSGSTASVAPATSGYDPAVERAKGTLQARLTELAGKNPFAVLDVHWSAYTEAVLAGFRDRVMSLRLDERLKHTDAEVKGLAAKLLAALEAARDALQTRPQREKIRRQVADRLARASALDMYEKQGDMALFRGDIDAARDNYMRIAELDPDHTLAHERLEALRGKTQIVGNDLISDYGKKVGL